MDLPAWTRTILIHRDHVSPETLDDVAAIDAPDLIGCDDDILWATFVRVFCLARLLTEARLLKGDWTDSKYESSEEAHRLRYLAVDLARVGSARWWRERGWMHRGDPPDVMKSFDDAKRHQQLHIVDRRYVLTQDLVLVCAAG